MFFRMVRVVKKEMKRCLLNNIDGYYEKERKKLSNYYSIKRGAYDVLKIEGKVGQPSGSDAPSVTLFYKDRVLSSCLVGKGGNFSFKIKDSSNIHVIIYDFKLYYGDVSLQRAASLQERYFKKLERKSDKTIDWYLDNGYYLSKKGDFLPIKIDADKKLRYLTLYKRLLEYFKKNYGYELAVSHGTLLGIVRDKDFIDKDDDFDLMYLSNLKCVRSVAGERTSIMKSLRKEGYNCYISPTGHIQVLDGDVLIDIMPAWIDDGNFLNISSYTQIKNDGVIFQKFIAIEFLSQIIRITENAEYFLEKQYGLMWHMPDSSYRSKITPAGRFNRLLLSPRIDQVLLYHRKGFFYAVRGFFK